ncbi:MAG: class B sortase [Clostridiales bacterium]|nr:class B sortase [Candidatus Coliplasma caballi]
MKQRIRNRDTKYEAQSEGFVSSLQNYSAEEFRGDSRDRRSSALPDLLLRFAVIGVCIAVLGYSVYMIADKLAADYRAERAYEDIRASEEEYSPVRHALDLPEPKEMLTVQQMLDAGGEYEDYVPSDYVPEDEKAHYASIYRNFLKLSAQYPDMYAWIYMTDTKVDYPVMKHNYGNPGKKPDNEFYLKHNYKGVESAAGSISADVYLNDTFYANRNMIIYGHNMKGNLMFHSLKLWCEDDKNRSMIKTSQIEIYTKEGVYIYRILGWYIDNSRDFVQQNFSDEADFLNFVANANKKAGRNKSGIEYNSESRVCTLITCTSGDPNNPYRYVVHGILNSFLSFDSEQ